MKLKPLENQVILKPVKPEEVTKSGIILPETAGKEATKQGVVEAVGEGKLLENGQRQPMSVKVGDRVIFKSYMPTDVKIEGEEFLILSENDILAIIE
jgi:chaperonin GroES